MIYWLFSSYFSREAGTLRMGMAALLSFFIVLLLGPLTIRYLLRKKVGDRPEFDHMDLNQLTKHKSNTPTMGGVLIILAIFLSVLMFADLYNFHVRMGLLTLVWLSVLGGMDDWYKLRRVNGQNSRDGLVMWIKLVFQIGLSVLLSTYMYNYPTAGKVPDGAGVGGLYPAHNLYLPFLAAPFFVTPLAHAVVTSLTMVGCSNAVNLTDGMDGLAAGCVTIVAGVLAVLAFSAGSYVDLHSLARTFHVQAVPGSLEMGVMCAAMFGACLGFLWFNAHPAQVFMGDTGSLTLGGLLGFVAVVLRQEMLLLVAGGVFVMEATSVMLQVSYFKLTKGRSGQGKRLFRCAPLHHHYHLGGLAESKVVARFWILGILFAVMAMATLKLKW